jgi:hypothetical protein
LKRTVATPTEIRRIEEAWEQRKREYLSSIELQRTFVQEAQNVNREIWNRLTKSEQDKVVKNVLLRLRGRNNVNVERNDPQSVLRVALYVVAAITVEHENLKEELRNIISEFRGQRYFTPPGGSQIWGLAINPTVPQEVAIGDDNGVVWIWDRINFTGDDVDGSQSSEKMGLQTPIGRALTASGGIVNSVAYNVDGSLLAAAYRNAGVIVWRRGVETPVCNLQKLGEKTLGSHSETVSSPSRATSTFICLTLTEDVK